jgi:hypothetical protein
MTLMASVPAEAGPTDGSPSVDLNADPKHPESPWRGLTPVTCLAFAEPGRGPAVQLHRPTPGVGDV